MRRFAKHVFELIWKPYGHFTSAIFSIFRNYTHRNIIAGGAGGLVLGCAFTLFVAFGVTRNCTSVFNSSISFHFLPVVYAAPTTCPVLSPKQIAEARVKAAKKEGGLRARVKVLNQPYNLTIFQILKRWFSGSTRVPLNNPELWQMPEDQGIAQIVDRIIKAEPTQPQQGDIDRLIAKVLQDPAISAHLTEKEWSSKYARDELEKVVRRVVGEVVAVSQPSIQLLSEKYYPSTRLNGNSTERVPKKTQYRLPPNQYWWWRKVDPTTLQPLNPNNRVLMNRKAQAGKQGLMPTIARGETIAVGVYNADKTGKPISFISAVNVFDGDDILPAEVTAPTSVKTKTNPPLVAEKTDKTPVAPRIQEKPPSSSEANPPNSSQADIASILSLESDINRVASRGEQYAVDDRANVHMRTIRAEYSQDYDPVYIAMPVSHNEPDITAFTARIALYKKLISQAEKSGEYNPYSNILKEGEADGFPYVIFEDRDPNSVYGTDEKRDPREKPLETKLQLVEDYLRIADQMKTVGVGFLALGDTEYQKAEWLLESYKQISPDGDHIQISPFMPLFPITTSRIRANKIKLIDTVFIFLNEVNFLETNLITGIQPIMPITDAWHYWGHLPYGVQRFLINLNTDQSMDYAHAVIQLQELTQLLGYANETKTITSWTSGLQQGIRDDVARLLGNENIVSRQNAFLRHIFLADALAAPKNTSATKGVWENNPAKELIDPFVVETVDQMLEYFDTTRSSKDLRIAFEKSNKTLKDNLDTVSDTKWNAHPQGSQALLRIFYALLIDKVGDGWKQDVALMEAVNGIMEPGEYDTVTSEEVIRNPNSRTDKLSIEAIRDNAHLAESVYTAVQEAGINERLPHVKNNAYRIIALAYQAALMVQERVKNKTTIDSDVTVESMVLLNAFIERFKLLAKSDAVLRQALAQIAAEVKASAEVASVNKPCIGGSPAFHLFGKVFAAGPCIVLFSGGDPVSTVEVGVDGNPKVSTPQQILAEYTFAIGTFNYLKNVASSNQKVGTQINQIPSEQYVKVFRANGTFFIVNVPTIKDNIQELSPIGSHEQNMGGSYNAEGITSRKKFGLQNAFILGVSNKAELDKYLDILDQARSEGTPIYVFVKDGDIYEDEANISYFSNLQSLYAALDRQINKPYTGYHELRIQQGSASNSIASATDGLSINWDAILMQLQSGVPTELESNLRSLLNQSTVHPRVLNALLDKWSQFSPAYQDQLIQLILRLPSYPDSFWMKLAQLMYSNNPSFAIRLVSQMPIEVTLPSPIIEALFGSGADLAVEKAQILQSRAIKSPQQETTTFQSVIDPNDENIESFVSVVRSFYGEPFNDEFCSVANQCEISSDFVQTLGKMHGLRVESYDIADIAPSLISGPLHGLGGTSGLIGHVFAIVYDRNNIPAYLIDLTVAQFIDRDNQSLAQSRIKSAISWGDSGLIYADPQTAAVRSLLPLMDNKFINKGYFVITADLLRSYIRSMIDARDAHALKEIDSTSIFDQVEATKYSGNKIIYSNRYIEAILVNESTKFEESIQSSGITRPPVRQTQFDTPSLSGKLFDFFISKDPAMFIKKTPTQTASLNNVLKAGVKYAWYTVFRPITEPILFIAGSIINRSYLREITANYGAEEAAYIDRLSNEMVGFRDKQESRELYESEPGKWSILLSNLSKKRITLTLFGIGGLVFDSQSYRRTGNHPQLRKLLAMKFLAYSRHVEEMEERVGIDEKHYASIVEPAKDKLYQEYTRLSKIAYPEKTESDQNKDQFFKRLFLVPSVPVFLRRINFLNSASLFVERYSNILLNYQTNIGMAISPSSNFKSENENQYFHEFWHMVQGLKQNKKLLNESLYGFEYRRVDLALQEGLTQLVEINAYGKNLAASDRFSDYHYVVAKTALTLKAKIYKLAGAEGEKIWAQMLLGDFDNAFPLFGGMKKFEEYLLSSEMYGNGYPITEVQMSIGDVKSVPFDTSKPIPFSTTLILPDGEQVVAGDIKAFILYSGTQLHELQRNEQSQSWVLAEESVNPDTKFDAVSVNYFAFNSQEDLQQGAESMITEAIRLAEDTKCYLGQNLIPQVYAAGSGGNSGYCEIGGRQGLGYSPFAVYRAMLGDAFGDSTKLTAVTRGIAINAENMKLSSQERAVWSAIGSIIGGDLFTHMLSLEKTAIPKTVKLTKQELIDLYSTYISLYPHVREALAAAKQSGVASATYDPEAIQESFTHIPDYVRELAIRAISYTLQRSVEGADGAVLAAPVDIDSQNGREAQLAALRYYDSQFFDWLAMSTESEGGEPEYLEMLSGRAPNALAQSSAAVSSFSLLYPSVQVDRSESTLPFVSQVVGASSVSESIKYGVFARYSGDTVQAATDDTVLLLRDVKGRTDQSVKLHEIAGKVYEQMKKQDLSPSSLTGLPHNAIRQYLRDIFTNTVPSLEGVEGTFIFRMQDDQGKWVSVVVTNTGAPIVVSKDGSKVTREVDIVEKDNVSFSASSSQKSGPIWSVQVYPISESGEQFIISRKGIENAQNRLISMLALDVPFSEYGAELVRMTKDSSQTPFIVTTLIATPEKQVVSVKKPERKTIKIGRVSETKPSDVAMEDVDGIGDQHAEIQYVADGHRLYIKRINPSYTVWIKKKGENIAFRPQGYEERPLGIGDEVIFANEYDHTPEKGVRYVVAKSGDGKYMFVNTEYLDSKEYMEHSFFIPFAAPTTAKVFNIHEYTEKRTSSRSMNIKKCLSDVGFLKKVYAADKDEEEGACPWYMRAPVRVLSGMAIVEVLWQIWLYFGPTVGKYATVPSDPSVLPPMVEGHYCYQGMCADGCSTGFTCSKESDTSGCCVAKEGYSETICSLDNNAEIDRKIEHADSYLEIAAVRYCANNSCSNGHCAQSLSDYSAVPTCDSLYKQSNGGITQFTFSPSVRVRPCLKPDGSLYNMLGFSESELSTMKCNADNTTIVEKNTDKTILNCGTGLICDTVFDDPTCTTPWRGIDHFIGTRNDGFFWTPDGYRCKPNAMLPKVQENPCASRCNAEGTTAYPTIPMDCSPTTANLTDRVCETRSNGQLAVYRQQTLATGVEKNIDETCDSTCAAGMCANFTGEKCSNENELSMRSDGSCYVRCHNGKFEDTAACDTIRVESYNNLGKQIIYESLSMLPDGIVENMYMKTISHYWSPSISILGDFNQMKFIKTVAGFAGEFIRLEDLNSWELRGEDPKELVIHEVMHEWAAADSFIFPRIPFASVVSDAANALVSGVTRVPTYGVAPVPISYATKVGCKRDGIFSGTFSYSSTPVTGYSINPVETECGEDFADSAAWYVTKPCELLSGGITGDYEAGELRYKYFKESAMFEGREYIPPSGCKGG